MKKVLTAMLTALTLACTATGLIGCSDPHVHTYASEYTYDSVRHWQKSTCEHDQQTANNEEHNFVDGVCSVCGYVSGNEIPGYGEVAVVFNANGGSFEDGYVAQQIVEANSLLSSPSTPTRSGYALLGWSKVQDGTQLWDFDNDRAINSITLYAVWVEEISVTIDANGGIFSDGESQISLTVNKGAALANLETPVRLSYAFTGWYKDGALSQKWDFDTDVVESATTLYAGWELVIEEHDVTFVLNYEGAEEVVKSTEEGLITYIPTRDGYVFNGWWISDGQLTSGEYILVEKYDTAKAVVEDNLVLYAEWILESTVSSELNAPSVSIDGNEFSWQAVANATGYDVRVYNALGEEQSKESLTATKWYFPSGYEAGYYSIKIRAIGDGENTFNSQYVTKSYAHKTLSVISNVEFDISTSVLTWTPVKNATAYELYIANELVEELTYASYDMSDYEAGSYSIKIIATRDDYISSMVSKTITKRHLKTPEFNDLYIDKDTGNYVLSWDKVALADTYILNINGNEVKVQDKNVYEFSASAVLWSQENTLKITMTSFDSFRDYLMSGASQELVVTKVYKVTFDKTLDEQGLISVNGNAFVPQTTLTENDQTATDASQLVGNKKYWLKATEKVFVADYVYVEAGTEITVLSEINLGYQSLGWYNGEDLITAESSLTVTVNQDITYTAKAQIKQEMQAFNFTSSLTTCVINSIKDTTATEIVVPNYVTEISAGAFTNCSLLESITLPFVGGSAKTPTDTYQYPLGYVFGTTYFEGSVAVSQYYHASNANSSISTTYYVPSTLKNVTVTGENLLYGAFYNLGMIENVTLSENVKAINNYVFYNCSLLKTVVIGSNVESIGTRAFEYCQNLEKVYYNGTIDQWVQIDNNSIDQLFYAEEIYVNNQLVTEIELNSATQINKNAFYTYTKLTKVTLGNQVESIGECAFYKCTNLTTVIVGENSLLESIKTQAFYGCSLLESITIPKNVTSIEKYAFYECKGLTEINFNATACGDLSSGNYVFDYAGTNGNGITVNVGANVTKIPANLFYAYNTNYASKVKTVVFAEGSECVSIGAYAFRYCKYLTSINLPSALVTICDQAFNSCTSLQNVTIPNGVETIGYASFNGCTALTTLTIPSTVTKIGNRAFNGCTSLSNLIFEDADTWYRTTSSSYSGGTATALTTSSTNATYFTSTYSTYYWYKV